MSDTLDREQINEKIEMLSGWSLASDKEIQKVYKFDDFLGSIEFINKIVKEAEDMQHHPDILIQYNKVTLTLSTHDKGGLTDKDFNLAEKIDYIYEDKS